MGVDMLEFDDADRPLAFCDGEGFGRAGVTGHETIEQSVAKLISYDALTGELCISNGLARIVLRRDGTIRLEGKRIIETADERIGLYAAVIDLN